MSGAQQGLWGLIPELQKQPEPGASREGLGEEHERGELLD